MNPTRANTKSEMAPLPGTPSHMPGGGILRGLFRPRTSHKTRTTASTAVATRSANGLMSAADKKKLDVIPTQGLISSSTMTLGSTLKLSSNVSYLEGRGYVSYIREIGRTQTSFAIDSTIPAGSAPLQIIELVLRCIAGLENNLTISLLLAGDAANSSIAIPKGSKLITLSFMMLNGHIDKYSCYRVSVI